MGTTIKDIAEEAGVSIATVSFALNQTRYVSPELVYKIEKIAKEKGYVSKNKWKNKYRIGKKSIIAVILPCLDNGFFTHIVESVSKYALTEGYMISTYITDFDFEREKHILREVVSDIRIAGVVISPTIDNIPYKKAFLTDMPLVCIDRPVLSGESYTIVSENKKGVYMGVQHLIKKGHENIVMLMEKSSISVMSEYQLGYIEALKDYNVPYREELYIAVNLKEEDELEDVLKRLFTSEIPTAIFVIGDNLMLRLIKEMEKLGLKYPEDISIAGFADGDWCQQVRPSLSVFKKNTDVIGQRAISYIVDSIWSYENRKSWITSQTSMVFCNGSSVHNIARGPFGEKAVCPDVFVLSEEDENQLRKGDYKVAISFHFGGDEWTTLHKRAIVDTLNGFGIRVLSVADANFDPELQKTQLQGIMMQQPDAVIAVPVDEYKTANAFKEISSKTNLILINSMPNGFTKDDYSCWISVNERENGQNAAKILGDHFVGQNKVKVGMLIHGANYFATKQRDFFAEQILRESYPNIEVVSVREFKSIENTYEVCKEMFEDNKEIQGLYITWERPALEAIKALKDMAREDVVISTTDLDYEIVKHMLMGDMVIGLSSQRPYDQGVAAAIATAKTLLGKCDVKCIGVPPYRVNVDKLEKAWRDLTKTKMPDMIYNIDRIDE